MKLIKVEDHMFELFDELKYNHWVECKYCLIQRHSEYIESLKPKIGMACLSDEEKIIKDIIK